jgi:hypothetical protein
MKCIICNQRKGKRFCPAKNALICAQCCGEKRVLEIDCPESCEYLKVGRSHEVKEYVRHIRNADPRKSEMHDRVLRENEEIVAHLELVLAQARLTVRDLADKDAAEALDLLLETYRTEDKGILYEKTANDLRVDSLRRQLRGVVESYRNPDKGGNEALIGSQEKRLSLKSAIESLEFIRDLLASHLEAGVSPSSYVDLLARIIPRERPSDDTRRSIIIP